MEKAAFKLDTYRFVKAALDFDIPTEASLDIAIAPSGVLFLSKGKYVLTFQVVVTCEENSAEVVNVVCEAVFSFATPVKPEDVPSFFYPNSLAIVFPYVRAFVSTITLQANVRPVVLPTINLTGLTEELRKKTEVKE